jgi:hypothetical protein
MRDEQDYAHNSARAARTRHRSLTHFRLAKRSRQTFEIAHQVHDGKMDRTRRSNLCHRALAPHTPVLGGKLMVRLVNKK